MRIKFPAAFRLEVVLILAMIAFVGTSPSQALAENAEQVPTVLITGSTEALASSLSGNMQ